MNGNQKNGFATKWAPTLIVTGLAVAIMLLNFLIWDAQWVYTLTMILSCTLGGAFALWWAKRNGADFTFVLFNVIAIFFVILLVSFLFMVLPAILSPSPMPAVSDAVLI